MAAVATELQRVDKAFGRLFASDDPVAVYLPFSYQIGGYTLFLPRSCLRPIDMSFEAAMKLVLTGAVSREGAAPPEDAT